MIEHLCYKKIRFALSIRLAGKPLLLLNNNHITTSKKIFSQLDIENDNSWIELTPRTTQVTGPALFAPRNRKHKMVSMKLKKWTKGFLSCQRRHYCILERGNFKF